MSFSVLASFAALQLGGSSQIASMIFMYGAIFAIFYFVLIRPQQRQRKAHNELVQALKKGDEIVTPADWWAKSCTSPRSTRMVR